MKTTLLGSTLLCIVGCTTPPQPSMEPVTEITEPAAQEALNCTDRDIHECGTLVDIQEAGQDNFSTSP